MHRVKHGRCPPGEQLAPLVAELRGATAQLRPPTRQLLERAEQLLCVSSPEGALAPPPRSGGGWEGA